MLEGALQNRDGMTLLEATAVLFTSPDASRGYPWVAATAVDQLGIGALTLLVVRPDGHVGLRSDSDHLDRLANYQMLIASGGT